MANKIQKVLDLCNKNEFNKALPLLEEVIKQLQDFKQEQESYLKTTKDLSYLKNLANQIAR